MILIDNVSFDELRTNDHRGDMGKQHGKDEEPGC